MTLSNRISFFSSSHRFPLYHRNELLARQLLARRCLETANDLSSCNYLCLSQSSGDRARAQARQYVQTKKGHPRTIRGSPSISLSETAIVMAVLTKQTFILLPPDSSLLRYIAFICPALLFSYTSSFHSSTVLYRIVIIESCTQTKFPHDFHDPKVKMTTPFV